MTAKTILVQLHHKIQTFEHVNKHIVLVAQDDLIAYMRREFSFDHLQAARLGDSMHFHSYTLEEGGEGDLRLFARGGDIMTQLLTLNLQVAERERLGEPVTAPGIPIGHPDPSRLVSDDYIRAS